MKLNRRPTARNRERMLDNAAKSTQQTGRTEALREPAFRNAFGVWNRMKWCFVATPSRVKTESLNRGKGRADSEPTRL